ncbi:MAG: oligosaccharide flippase family protein [Pleurocapsa minor GSE-CHR-MK-17-07R]|jgi:O-antigen/teichoic acid export membrane protein|nr:oligosaccharide flippase family protein [Pleurocapsa minor GSE-CHR-MK 17-07R]
MRARLNRLLNRKFVRDTLVLQVAKIGVLAISLVSTVVTTRLLGPAEYGLFGLADALVVILTLINISGAFAVTATRLPVAIGARDEREALRVLAYGMQSGLGINLLIVLILAVFGGPLALALQGRADIGSMAAVLALALPADSVYTQLLHALQARRSMTLVSRLHVANQAILSAFMILTALTFGSAAGLVLARVAYSWLTMAMIALVYTRTRADDGFVLPRLRDIFRQIPRQSPRPYWRFGVANAIDKNISNTAPSILIQLVGAMGGVQAAGYLSLGMRVLSQLSVLTASVLENLNAAVPQAVGRGDFAGLQRNFARLLAAVGGASLVLYAALALVGAPLLPLLFGEDWRPVVPVVTVLSLYGVITAIGGNFGVLYRVFEQMRGAIAIKLVALAIAATATIAWLSSGGDAQHAAVAGAAGMVLLFGISVSGTAWMTLTALRRRARANV